MFESIDTLVYLKVYPPAMCVEGEVVLGDKFVGDVRDFDANIFWPVQRRSQVEIGDVETCKPHIWC